MNTESDLCSILEPFPPSNKCAQIAKEWLDKGLAKCHEIAVLYPSSRNPPAWIGKIHGLSFVDTSSRAEEASRDQSRESSDQRRGSRDEGPASSFPPAISPSATSPLSPSSSAPRHQLPATRHSGYAADPKSKINNPLLYPCPS